MKKAILSISLASIVVTTAIAGGDPEFIAYPDEYKKTDTQYATVNRVNGTQVAVLYANSAALGSIRYGDKLIPGSRIIMEIYQLKLDADEKPVKGVDGVYEKGDLAAVAVMEKSIEWPANFMADHRAGNWGFALYDPQGQIKQNDLDCASCHIPNTATDHLFTHAQLKAFVK